MDPILEGMDGPLPADAVPSESPEILGIDRFVEDPGGGTLGVLFPVVDFVVEVELEDGVGPVSIRRMLPECREGVFQLVFVFGGEGFIRPVGGGIVGVEIDRPVFVEGQVEYVDGFAGAGQVGKCGAVQ